MLVKQYIASCINFSVVQDVRLIADVNRAQIRAITYSE